MPRRLIRRRVLPFYGAAALVVVSFATTGYALHSRTGQVNDLLRSHDELIFEQCVGNEIQDAVIVAQLQAAKRRVIASLPRGVERQYQLQVLEDGIAALEPPEEPDCTPPEGDMP